MSKDDLRITQDDNLALQDVLVVCVLFEEVILVYPARTAACRQCGWCVRCPSCPELRHRDGLTQAQTAECLVVGEIAIQHMVVILNKVDLLPAESRAKSVSKAKKRLAQTFAATKFAGCPMLAVSSLPGALIRHIALLPPALRRLPDWPSPC